MYFFEHKYVEKGVASEETKNVSAPNIREEAGMWNI
jgi:hypothetical protein